MQRRGERGGRREGSDVVHNPSDSSPLKPCVEIDDESERFLRQTKAGKQLYKVNLGEHFHRLQLDKDEVSHDQVDPEGAPDNNSLIGNIERRLPPELETSERQLPA
jgi:hypothetical protein